MRAWLLVVFCLAMACHHDDGPAIVEPPGVPPLPPSSGTPIGYLVDDATDLKLSDDQLAKLKELDSALETQLDELETQMRAPVGGGSAAPATTGRRGRRGGGGMGSMGGGGGRHHGGGGGQQAGSAGAGSGGPVLHGASVAAVTAERQADVRQALERAMAVLDPVQRVLARKLLDDRGVDLADDATAAGSAAESAEPTEPDGGSGEP